MTEKDTVWTKEALRRSMREKLRAVNPETLREWSKKLVAKLQARGDLWSRAGTVALFGGLRSEPDLITDLLPWLKERGWRVTLFEIAGNELIPVEVGGVEDLRRGPLGVWVPPVPTPATTVPPARLDLILVPGLAFTAEGARLGRGGGFFDRFLARPDVRARRVGVAFEMQMVPEIPCEAHDVRVPEVVTEGGT